jgi:hypothetical protein
MYWVLQTEPRYNDCFLWRDPEGPFFYWNYRIRMGTRYQTVP